MTKAFYTSTIRTMALCSLFFCSCTKIGDNNNDNNIPLLVIPEDVAGPQIGIDSLPLKVGNTWIYEVMEQTIYDDGQKTEISTYNVQYTVSAETWVSGVRLVSISGSGLGLRNFARADSTYTDGYLNAPEGAYEMQSLEPLYITKDTGLLMIKLPIVVNEKWEELTTNYPNSTSRQWNGFYKVITPGGTFDCARLTCVSINPLTRSTSQEYYCARGLIQSVSKELGSTWGGGILGGDSKGYTKTIVAKLREINF